MATVLDKIMDYKRREVEAQFGALEIGAEGQTQEEALASEGAGEPEPVEAADAPVEAADAPVEAADAGGEDAGGAAEDGEDAGGAAEDGADALGKNNA